MIYGLHHAIGYRPSVLLRLLRAAPRFFVVGSLSLLAALKKRIRWPLLVIRIRLLWSIVRVWLLWLLRNLSNGPVLRLSLLHGRPASLFGAGDRRRRNRHRCCSHYGEEQPSTSA